jgi:L-asparaginase/Glu-tRNA(Gln) amidotransferase subunit D
MQTRRQFLQASAALPLASRMVTSLSGTQPQIPALPTVIILATGGTIASASSSSTVFSTTSRRCCQASN